MKRIIRVDDPIRGLINFFDSEGKLLETLRQEQLMSDPSLLQNTMIRLQYGEVQ